MADISLLPPDHFDVGDDDEQETERQDSGDPFAWTSGGGGLHLDRPADGNDGGPRSLEVEDEDGSGDAGGDADSGVSSQQEDECLMTPSQRLDNYALSENVLHRQMVPSVLVEMLRECSAEELEADLPRLMDTLARLADEPDTNVRAEVCSRLGTLAATLTTTSLRAPSFHSASETYILPLVARLLGDADAGVRKAAYAALLHLLEQRCVAKTAVEELVCPRVVHYTRQDAMMDYQTGAVTLMSKMVPLLGREVTERLFLQRFSELCSHPMFYIRKICASNFGEFCAIVGPEAYEEVLLPRFLELCCDDVWGVRKACAEVIMTVSCACPPVARRTRLAFAFARLLDDQSRWVRMSAYQTLGPFISTFADPSVIGLSYNQMGELVLINPEGAEFKINSPAFTDAYLKAAADFKQFLYQEQHDELWKKRRDLFFGSDDYQEDTVSPPPPPPPVSEDDNQFESEFDSKLFSKTPEKTDSKLEKFNAHQYWYISDPEENEQVENDPELEKFNTHQYWYISPDMPLDPDIVNSCLPNEERTLAKQSNDHVDNDIITDSLAEKFDDLTFNNSIDETNTENESMELSVSICGTKEPKITKIADSCNDIVPSVLISYFVSMTDVELASTTDNDMAYHCAFSLPAVALTLGRENWHVLARTCDALAADMQYKVRRTLASSLHELALILGQELACRHLLPIFDGLIKDLDEVRIGVLKHLAHFLELIGEEHRITYLPRLKEFLQTDNEWNWRFREEFARQLLAAIPLYAPRVSDAIRYLAGLMVNLLRDRVCAVRQVALELTCELVRHSVDVDKPLCTRLLSKLCEELAHSKRWARRQAFAHFCARLVDTRALSQALFADELLPHLLDLSWDPVPNVRLAVSRTLVQDVLANEYYNEEQKESLQTVVRRMQSDKDRDVRHFALLIAYN